MSLSVAEPGLGTVQQSYAIGLDIGGTKIAAGVVAFPTGRVLVRRSLATRPERGGQAVLMDALVATQQLLTEAGARELAVVGIGIGVAELVDPAGNVTSAHTIAWKGMPIQAQFSRLARAVVESDVRAAALAEALLGAGRPFKLFAHVTVGTGISYSLVQDRRPWAGARGNALILASSPLTTTCDVCGAKLNPVLEEIASGPALVTRYNARGTGQVSRGEDVISAMEAGDPVAVHVVRSAGAALGTSVGFLVNLLDPEAVVVGGGLGLVGGLYWASFVASARQHIWADTSRDLPLLPAALGTDAGLIGAAATIWQRAQEDEPG